MNYYNVPISNIKTKAVISTHNTLTTDEVKDLFAKNGMDEFDIPERISAGYRQITDDLAVTISK